MKKVLFLSICIIAALVLLPGGNAAWEERLEVSGHVQTAGSTEQQTPPNGKEWRHRHRHGQSDVGAGDSGAEEAPGSTTEGPDAGDPDMNPVPTPEDGHTVDAGDFEKGDTAADSTTVPDKPSAGADSGATDTASGGETADRTSNGGTAGSQDSASDTASGSPSAAGGSGDSPSGGTSNNAE